MSDRKQQSKIFRVFKEKKKVKLHIYIYMSLTETSFKDDGAMKTFLDEGH